MRATNAHVILITLFVIFERINTIDLPAFVAYVAFAEPALSAVAVAYVELEAEPNIYDLYISD